MKVNQDIEKAYQAALLAKSRAYAPHSNFQVGCAIKIEGEDELVIGCNVENTSYPAGICAERTALSGSVAKYGKKNCEYMVIVSNIEPPIFPCGLCLQTISHFGGPTLPIYLGNNNGIEVQTTLQELMPKAVTSLE